MSLNNFFKKATPSTQAEVVSDPARERQRQVRSVQLKARADNRIDTFQETRRTQQFMATMQKGAIPLLPISLHSFRDRFKDKEMEPTGGVYLKHFAVAKDRAQQTQDRFKDGHLKEDLFDPNLPNKNHAKWLRLRDISREQEVIRFGSRTEGERIRNILEQQKRDNEQRDMKMVNYPDWKPVQKEKWTGQKTFNSNNCMASIKSDPPWSQFEIINEQYTDGFETVGDLSRRRDKSKEAKRNEFISTVKPDIIGHSLHISKSLRTHKADQILEFPANYDEYSKNKQLKFYKTTLVETKSVNHLTPHQHSNNFQGLAFNDLRPKSQGKLYKLSIDLKKNTVVTKPPPTATTTIQPPQLANIQELSQVNIQSQTHIPPSRESNTGARTKKSVLEKYMGFPYHQEDDATTKKIISGYFKE